MDFLGKIVCVANHVTAHAAKGEPGLTLDDLKGFLGDRHSRHDDRTAAASRIAAKVGECTKAVARVRKAEAADDAMDADDADMAYAMAESLAIAAAEADARAAKAVAIAKAAEADARAAKAVAVAAERAAIAKRTEAAEHDAFQRGVDAVTAAKDARRAAATTAKRSVVSPCLDCASLRQMVEHLTVQIDELQKQNETQRKEIAGLHSMRRRYSELQGDHDALQQQLRTANREKEILRRSNAEKDESIERLKRQVEEQMSVMRAMGVDV